MKKDNVKFIHPEYMEYEKQVNQVYDLYNGIDNSVQYIFKLERESEFSLNTRKEKATLKNFIRRATEAFVGMIFRKQIETTMLDDNIMQILNKIDKHSNLNRFARDVATHLILGGKCFIGVDTPINGNSLPYAIVYDRNKITNWKYNEDGSFSLIVISEVVEEHGYFSVELVNQWRVYTEDGNVNLYRENKDGVYLYETIITEYDFIPIIPVFLSDVPPLYDISKLTIKHMNRTSLKDKYLDMCASPIPLIWGIQETDDNPRKPVFVVGADEAFLFDGLKNESDFEWRELSGTSIDKLQEDLKVIEEDITSGILRAATSNTTTIKTATQSFYEAAESSNRVVIIANSIEQSLNNMLLYLSNLANIQLDKLSSIIVNKDFNAVSGNPQDMRLLWEVYLGGALSIETFLDALNKHEVITLSSVRDEILKIEEDKFVPSVKEVSKDTIKNMDNNTVSSINNL